MKKTKLYILKNSKNKTIRFYNFNIQLFKDNFRPIEWFKKSQESLINDDTLFDYYHDKLTDSFDYLRDLTILLTVRIERFIQEYQMLLNESVDNCINFNTFLNKLAEQTNIKKDIEMIKKYVLISNLSKHGYGISMKKIIDNKINLTMYTKINFSPEKFIYADDKRIVDVELKDIEMYYKSIMNIMNYLIDCLNETDDE